MYYINDEVQMSQKSVIYRNIIVELVTSLLKIPSLVTILAVIICDYNDDKVVAVTLVICYKNNFLTLKHLKVIYKEFNKMQMHFFSVAYFCMFNKIHLRIRNLSVTETRNIIYFTIVLIRCIRLTQYEINNGKPLTFCHLCYKKVIRCKN